MENTEYIRKRDAMDMCGGYIELAYAMAGIDPADVVPVRHGHWTLVGWYKGLKIAECSCCKYRAIGLNNFCPNCGADMKGKQV